MRPAVALCVAAVCFAASVVFYQRRDGVLRFMARMRGYDRKPCGRMSPPPGPRRRYLRGPAGRIDMLSPAIGLMVVAMIFFVYGVATLSALR